LQSRTEGRVPLHIHPTARPWRPVDSRGSSTCWTWQAGRCSPRSPGHEGFLRSVSVTNDGRSAVTGGFDQTIRVWDLASAREGRRIDAGGLINECVLTPDGLTVIARMYSSDARDDTPLRRWNLADGQEIRAPELVARSMKLAADGHTLATIHG